MNWVLRFSHALSQKVAGEALEDCRTRLVCVALNVAFSCLRERDLAADP